MTMKYKPKATEVEALELRVTNLGGIIYRVQKYSEEPIVFQSSINEDGILFLKFENDENECVAETGDYFVFGEADFDILSPSMFNATFEPVPVKVDDPTDAPKLPLNPPFGVSPMPKPFTIRDWPPNGHIPWNEIIVKD